LSGCARALDGEQTGQVAREFVRQHLQWHSFDDTLSHRALDRLLALFDPGKLYFLRGDVAQLEQAFGDKLDDLVLAGDWSFLQDLLKAYRRRFEARAPFIDSLIDEKQDLATEDFYTLPAERQYLDTEAALDERWRTEIKLQKLNLAGTLPSDDEVRQRLHGYYDRRRREVEERSQDDLCTTFLRAFALSLDPHCQYQTQADLRQFMATTRLHLVGIGIRISQPYGLTTIMDLVPGGPAEKSGLLQAGDAILAVAEGGGEPVDVTELPISRVVDLITGPIGTEVRLTVRRRLGSKIVLRQAPVTRDDVKLKDQAATGRALEVRVGQAEGEALNLKLGVVRLPSFYGAPGGPGQSEGVAQGAAADVRRRIAELADQGIQAVILDLRSNGGGLLDEAVSTAGLFFDSGPVVQVRSKADTQFPADTDGKTAYAGPLVVLVNRLSASASEIVAAVLQDYGRALVVGDSHTFGKGTVQKHSPLRDTVGGGAMVVTISQFYRVNGSTTQFQGVTPDLDLPGLAEVSDLGEQSLDYALPPTKVEPTSYPHLDQVAPYLERLRLASQARVQQSQVFQKIAKEIEEQRAHQDRRGKIAFKQPDAKANGGKDKRNASGVSADPYLQECLAIGADYVQLRNGRPLGAVSVVEAAPPDAKEGKRADPEP
jgi:carboxyl-terminal processing protease